jgi:hypothetical protein
MRAICLSTLTPKLWRYQSDVFVKECNLNPVFIFYCLSLLDCLLFMVSFTCSVVLIFLYLPLLNPSLIPQLPIPCIHSFTKYFSILFPLPAYLRLFVLLNIPDLSTDSIWQNTWCTQNRLAERKHCIFVFGRFSVLIPAGLPPTLSVFIVIFLSPSKSTSIRPLLLPLKSLPLHHSSNHLTLYWINTESVVK